MPRKIVIDTDPGVDDAMAIIYALSCPELEVVALTTVFGNHNVDVCTSNALQILEVAGRSDIPVARGAARPLAMDYLGAVELIHGEDGQGNVHLPAPSTLAVSTPAARYIVDLVMANPGEITLVPIGPLTNIALALMMEPRLASNLVAIVIMGGNGFVCGNVSPAAEANIHNDPEAADIVFGADCPIVMLGLDVTTKTNMTSAHLARYGASANPPAQYLAKVIPFYSDFHFETTGMDGIHVHDSSTITYLVRPDLYTTVSHPIRVDCGHGIGRGNTIASERVPAANSLWAGRRNVTICVTVDAEAAIDLELGRVCD